MELGIGRWKNNRNSIDPYHGEKEIGQINQIPGGDAKPAPPMGPALGQLGVPIMPFCEEFSAKTPDMAGSIVPVVITVYQDKSFDTILKSPPASDLLKKAAGIASGSVPNKDKVGKVARARSEIAEKKKNDLNAFDEEKPRASSPAPPAAWASTWSTRF